VARPGTKKRPARPKRKAAGKGRRPQRRQPPPPWYRRPEGRTVLVVIAVAVIAAIGLLATRGGEQGQTSPSLPVVGPDLHSLAVDRTDPDRLWIGRHRGGVTWSIVPSLDGADAMGWAFLGDTILVGGHPGFAVSTDGGRTFKRRNEGLPATDVHALGAGESVIYGASPAAGVFASTDGGTTWAMRTAEAGQGFMGSILVDPDDDEHVVAPDMQAGAVKSTDGGKTWTALGGVPGAMWVSWDPRDTDHIIVTTQGGAAETTDGGETWKPIDTPDGASIVEMDPSNPRVLYAAVHDDPNAIVWISRNGGQTWAKP
jgi:photosystem II stability/assembly factor-like uncharacterized protein